MNITRRLVIILITGFIAGSVAGGILLHLKGNEVRQLAQREESFFELKCQGGAVPEVVITWPERLESIVSGLERSEGGGAWTNIGADPAESKLRFVDTGVVAGKTYNYHVVWTGIEVVQPIAITTDLASCTQTP